jgi:hypothetical protein
MKRLLAAQIALMFALIVRPASAATPVELTMDELPMQPVNGLSLEGVTFGFTVNGAASTDATFNAPNGGIQADTQDPVIEGNAEGVLTVNFASPTPEVQFGVSLLTSAELSPGFSVKLLNSGTLVQSTSVNTAPVGSDSLTEGLFAYSGAPVNQAVVTFNSSGSRFGFDNLVYEVPGPPTVPAMPPWGVLRLALVMGAGGILLLVRRSRQVPAS